MVSWAAKMFCVMMIMGVTLAEDPVYPDDEVTPVVAGVEHPLPVLIEPMQRAARAIEESIFGNESDHELFLSDWWPVPLNNSSILNPTA